MIIEDRKCGILIHPTSFPSPYGIGDLGEESREILKKLASAGVRLWQILPLGPTGYGDSPYASRSSFAGNEYLIDLRQMEGYGNYPDFSNSRVSRVNYTEVYEKKLPLLKKAASCFLKENSNRKDFCDFCIENSWWLNDYALYQCLVNHFNDSRWYAWPDDIKNREKQALSRYSAELHDEIEIYKALQFFFFKQWNSLHKFANGIGLQIIGDIPIFAAADSSDAWADRQLFKIDSNGNQTCCAGCPPDGFTADGQMWGNPVYNWEVHKKDEYKWFRKRVEHTLSMVDIVRIDHFRGLESYWEIPAGKNAASGKWVKSPGMNLVKYLKGKNIIAEDLGVITPEVEKLLNDSGFPGMKVLQFAFDLSNGKLNKGNYYLPQNIYSNCVVYTGTHDNQTSRGWFESQSDSYKDIVRRYLQCPDSEVVWQMMRVLLQSPAKYAIFPMQDLLGLDDNARMNCPSTVGTFNWSWRMNPDDLQQWMLDRLAEYIYLYGRI